MFEAIVAAAALLTPIYGLLWRMNGRLTTVVRRLDRTARRTQRLEQKIASEHDYEPYDERMD